MTTLRYAIRSLLQSPGYTCIALITLALGIGVNTSMFSVVNALLFRTAPYPSANDVVQLTAQTRNGELRGFSEQEIREIRSQAESFSSLTAAAYAVFTLTEPGRPGERLQGVSLSSGMMDTFRVQPMLGRPFTAEEFEQGKNQVVLLSEGLWRTRFAADPGVIGRTLRLDGEPVTVVGVMPAVFDYRMYWGNVLLWRPLNYTPDQLNFRGYRQFPLIGRLKDSAAMAGIPAQLAPLATRLEKEFPQDYPGLRYQVLPLHEAAMDDVGRSISWMLLGLAGFVLLIACANLANLQLARATANVRDFAIRAALGASRSRLVVQQLAECVVLSLTGGALGFLVALWVNRMLERSILIGGAPGLEITMDGRILVATLIVSLLTGIVFGVLPALFASRADVMSSLKSQARGSTGGRGQQRMRHALIVGEIALALILLGGAAIMNRGFSRMLERPTGWDTTRVLTAVLPVPETRYPTGDKRMELFRRIEDKLALLPGVEHAALATSLPLFNYTSDRQVFLDAPAGEAQVSPPVASHVMITPRYFDVMGIPLLEGQFFAPDLKVDGPPYMIVNEALARQFWPNESAVGKRLGSTTDGKTVWREIIGVVRDVEPAANFANPPTRLTVYRPLVQETWSYVNVVLRSQNPAALTESMSRVISEVDPDLALDQVGTIPDFVKRTQHNFMVVGKMLMGFAALGLALAAVGIYGVISHLVAQRTSEFGIRLALGARPLDVLVNVLQRGIWLSCIGVLIGLLGAYGFGRFLASIMPRLASSDPFALVAVAALLFGVTLIACWFPAWRATKVDPMVALRAE
jgi:putative ABC transport system permease protein